MQLIDNWKRTLTHGYSTWMIYASIVLQFAYDNVTVISEILPGWIALLILVAALMVRILHQESVSGAKTNEPA